VKDCHDEEHCDANDKPPWRERFVMKREPGSNQCGNYYEKTEISKAEMQAFEVRDLCLAGLLALLVLLGWGGIEGRHRGIIAYLCAPPSSLD
jgi:hypothetical protein